MVSKKNPCNAILCVGFYNEKKRLTRKLKGINIGGKEKPLNRSELETN